jgi:hypothetical protein
MVVNIESVRLGRPLSRTTRMASDTCLPTFSPTPRGVIANATSMDLHGIGDRRARVRAAFRSAPRTRYVRPRLGHAAAPGPGSNSTSPARIDSPDHLVLADRGGT